ncbi:MAG: rane protein [Caulobacter sp.]|nr:rane protein [Caulobacter sp.]
MIRVEAAYVLAGLIFGAIAVFSARDSGNPKRWNNTAFWGLFALSFLAGGRLGNFGNGLLVLAMVLIGGLGGIGLSKPATTTPEEREASSLRWGSKLFLPVLAIPITALVGTLVFKAVKIAGAPLVDPKQVTVISMALGVVIALAIVMAMLRPPLSAPPQEARRLMDTVGWAAILPQLLASLGAVFALAGVGDAVGELIHRFLPVDTPFAAVATYCIGMALFTMIMGNAFAAFPVLTAGVGVPLIVHRFGGDPAIMGSIGMLAGFCGTLMTPMASHNIVPTALLQLPGGAVIRAQTPTALLVLTGNILLMYLLVFRF